MSARFDSIRKGLKEAIAWKKGEKTGARVRTYSAMDVAETQVFRDRHLQQKIAAGMADIKAGRVAAGKDVIQRMKKRVIDADL